MEFPARTITNFKVIDGFTNPCCKLYSTNPPVTSTAGPAFKDELSGHSVDLDVAALTLRSSGCLVSAAPNGYGLWVFSGDGGFDALRGFSSDSADLSCSVIEVDGFNFTCCASGTISMSEVTKRSVSEPSSSLFQQSIFQTLSGDGILAETILQRMTTYSIVYMAFVSAFSGLLIHRAILTHGAIPLGKRTLFTAGGLDSCEGRDVTCSSIQPTAFLSTLDVDITARGRLIVSWRVSPQDALERLSNDAAPWLPFNEDLWLAPTGTVCRYVSTVENQSTAIPSKVQNWKRALSVWFQKMGLDFQETIWVEVEVLNPLNHQRGAMRVDAGDSDEHGPTNRIFWPATYCFRRTKPEHNINGPQFFQADFEHPLDFAERWMADSVGWRAPITPSKRAQPEVEREDLQSKVATPNAPKGTLPDTVESLARTINDPDSNVFQGVYPTPPGGSMAPNVAMTATEGPDPITTYVLNTSGEEQNAYQSEDIPSAGLSGDLDVPSQLGVGSGMYDTIAEDDLFGDMGDDFGGKGITEADFNFFDDPDFAGLQETTMQQDPQEPMIEEEQITRNKTDPAVGPVPADPDTEEVHMADLLNQAPHGGSHVRVPSGMERNNADGATGMAIGQAKGRPMSPPLSPSRVNNILLAQGGGTNLWPSVSQNPAPHNRYEPVPFKETLWSSDQKYEQAGRFWFNSGQEKQHREAEIRRYPTDIPLIGHPSRIGNKHHGQSRRYAELTIGDEINSGEPSTLNSADRSSDDESQLSVSPSNGNTPSSCHASGRRKQSALGTSKPESPLVPLDASGAGDGSTSAHCSSLVGSLILRSTDWSFSGYFSRKQSEIAPVLCETAELTLVAQLVVDQVTQSSFAQGIDGVVDRPELEQDNSHSLYHFTDAADLLDMGQQLDLQAYSAMDDTSDATEKRKDAPSQAKSTTTSGISKLDPPYVRIRRGDRYLEALPPAVPFWEIFGLEPLLGQKDTIAYCIYPQSAKDDADSFLERLGSTYSGASFGKHSRSGNDNGLIPWGLGPNGEPDYASLMSSLQDTCEKLGTALTDLSPSDENVVVYVLNPFCHGAALADTCTAFLRLFHKYVEDTSRRHLRLFHEVVLQVVPLRFVTSPDSLVAPPQLDYLRLSLEVYSRCAPKSPNMDDIACAPPLALEEPVPKTVPFKLSSDPVSPLESGRCFHIAYSHSIDRRWITVAWTDSAGRHQTSMSYCLWERGSGMSRSVVEVLGDIWGATQDILGMSHRHWQVMIAKDGPMETEEITAWTTFAQKQNQLKPSKVELSLLSVNTSPGLFLKIPPSQPQLSAFSQQIAQPSQGNLTPVATPKPGVPSPEPSSSASTPYPATNLHTPNEQQQQQQQAHTHQQPQQPRQHPSQQQQQAPQHPPPDPNQDQTILADKSDDTWAVILSHKLNVSNSLSTYLPAHASGYLIRRLGISDTEGLASLTVNVIYWQSRVSADVLLRDVLRMYRDLATLSRTRGIANAQGDCPLPWHIATAVRGQEALSYIL